MRPRRRHPVTDLRRTGRTRRTSWPSALRAAGVGPGERVAVAVPRSLEQVVALVAIVSAGGAYVPLDLAYPDERLEYVLADAAPQVVLVDREQRDRFTRLLARAGVPARVLVQGDELPRAATEADGPRSAGTTPRTSIYTSGSTGRPKGVVVPHSSVVTLLANTRPDMDFGPHDVWVQFHSFSFDFAVWELWGALAHGGELLVPEYGLTRSPVDFHRLVRERGVTVLNQTPSAFYQFIEADRHADEPLPALRRIIFGGEALDLGRLRGWVERHGTASPELVNMYGITETTVHVTHRVLTDEDFGPGDDVSPIGGPIPGLVTYLLDDRLRPVPPGRVGAIYVAGDQVSLGYLGRPGLTAGRFVADPFAGDGSRMYHTGDLARRTLDGELEFTGRADDQVQLKGFRIELGEVEAAIRELDGVVDVAVTVADSGDHLVAHVVGRVPADFAEPLSTKLPVHMVPARVLPVDALPLTVNGKLDRKALTERAAGRTTPRGRHVPRSRRLRARRAGRHLRRHAARLRRRRRHRLLPRPAATASSPSPSSTGPGRSACRSRHGTCSCSGHRARSPSTWRRAHRRARRPRRPPAARTARCRRPRSSCASANWADRSPGSPRPGRCRRPKAPGFADAERAANAVVAAHPALRLRLRVEHGVWALRTEPAREVTVVRPDTTDADGRGERGRRTARPRVRERHRVRLAGGEPDPGGHRAPPRRRLGVLADPAGRPGRRPARGAARRRRPPRTPSTPKP